MAGILLDINVQGHVECLQYIWQNDYWQEVWTSLGWPILTFPDVGLAFNTPDSVIWQLCQQRQWILITSNRKDEGPESLEATIRTYNTSECLPVFTLADPEQLRQSRTYAERVAEKLLDYFLNIDAYRGTGRLYVP